MGYEYKKGDVVFYSEDEGTLRREEGVGVVSKTPAESNIGYHVIDATGTELYMYEREIKRLASVADRARWRIKHGW